MLWRERIKCAALAGPNTGPSRPACRRTRRRDHANGRKKPVAMVRYIVAAGLVAALGGCTAGADRSVLEIVTFDKPGPPKPVEYPRTAGELKNKVKWDGYPDTSFVPNPERLPELSKQERAEIEAELAETGESLMENRIMDCGAEDPADCVQ
jgi:hypothetical protein